MKISLSARWLCLGIAAAVPLFTATAAMLLALPLPVYDYWDILGMIENIPAGDWNGRLAFFWGSFVDQKMVGPKMLIWGLSRLTNYRHLRLEIVAGLVMQFGVLLIAARLAQRTPGLPGRRQGFWWAFISALLFWPLLLGRFQHHWYSTQYSLVLLPAMGAVALLAPERPGGRRIISAAILALIAGLSHGTGLLLWPVLGLALILARRTRLAGLAGLAAALGLIAIIISQHLPRAELGFSPLSAPLESPGIMISFALRCLGLSLGLWALPLGAGFLIGTGAAVFTLARRGSLSPYRPWLIIWSWTLLTAAGTALNRSSDFRLPFLHYNAFFILGWIAGGVLAAGAGAGWRARFPRTVRAGRILAAAGVAAWITGAVAGIGFSREFLAGISRASRHLQSWPVVERRHLAPLFPEERFERGTLPVLAGRRAFGLDPRPVKPLEDVKLELRKDIKGLSLIPNRALTADEMLAFSDYRPERDNGEAVLHGRGRKIRQRLRRYRGRSWLVWGEYPDLAVERIELRGFDPGREPEIRLYGRTD